MVENEKVDVECQTPTIRDVARWAQVSTATVSRALNNDVRVSPGTKAKVFDAVSRLDYRPNLEAINLGRRNTGVRRDSRLEHYRQ